MIRLNFNSGSLMLKSLDNFLEKITRNFVYISNFSLRLALGVAFIIHGISKFPLPPKNLIEFFGFSPFLASFVAISEVIAGSILILAGLIKTFVGNLLTRICAFIIVVIMIFAFYFAHMDWFFNSKLFTSEQIFLLLVGFYFLINGNKIFK